MLTRELPILVDLKIGILRMEFPWWAIEKKAKGDFDWARPDLIVERANAAGIALAPVLVFTPAWATPGCTNPRVDCKTSNRISSCPAQPPSPADFADFAFAIASRYRGRIPFWEMWNEPDLPTYFAGSATAYVHQVLAPAGQAVKSADPTARVILGGPSSPNTTWLDEVLAEGGDLVFDILAFHDYRSLRSVLEGAAAFKARVAGKPLWLNELGSERPDRQRDLIEGVFGVDSPLQAAFWYELRDDDIFSSGTRCGSQRFGLLDHNYVPKASFAAFQALA